MVIIRKTQIISITFLFGIMLLCAAITQIALGKERAAKINYIKEPIKVFIKGFDNTSEQRRLNTDDFKNSLREALSTWKMIQFECVDNPISSDVEISGTITKYLYTDKDPMAKINGSPTLDSKIYKNYVEMECEFVVTETPTGKTLWSDRLTVFVRKDMAAEESFSIISYKLTRIFISRVFKKSQD